METRDKKRVIKIVRKNEALSETAAIDKANANSFWESETLEELAREYGVKPYDPAENGKNWPEGADFESFKKAINEGRKYPREW